MSYPIMGAVKLSVPRHQADQCGGAKHLWTSVAPVIERATLAFSGETGRNVNMRKKDLPHATNDRRHPPGTSPRVSEVGGARALARRGSIQDRVAAFRTCRGPCHNAVTEAAGSRSQMRCSNHLLWKGAIVPVPIPWTYRHFPNPVREQENGEPWLLACLLKQIRTGALHAQDRRKV